MYTFFITDPNLQTNPLIKQQDLYSSQYNYGKLETLTFWNQKMYQFFNGRPSSESVRMGIGYQIVNQKPSEPYFYYINAHNSIFKKVADIKKHYQTELQGKFLVPEIIHKDLDDDKCRIILDDTTEGTSVSQIDKEKFETFVGPFKNKIIFVNSDYNRSFQNILPTSYRNLWEKFVASKIYRQQADNDYVEFNKEKLERIKDGTQAKYKAICKNRLIRSHRLHLCRFIEQNGLSNDINYSCGMTLYHYSDKNEIFHKLDAMDRIKDEHYKTVLLQTARTYQIDYDELVSWCQKIGTKKLDFESTVDLSLNQAGVMTKELFQAHLNCYFEIVSESSVLDDTLFHSEKSFMPILFMNPFVLFGEFGSVNALRELGYDMFDDIIDHTYDTIINERERANMLFSEIERLCDISHQEWCDMLQSIQHRLIKNRMHLVSCYSRHNELHTPNYKNKCMRFEGVSLD